MITILGLAGSLRRRSWNRRLLEAATTLVPDGLRLVPSPSLAEIPLFNEDEEQPERGGPEPVSRLRRAVREADGLLIATPEYNQSIPGVLKNVVDWLSRPGPDRVLERKPVAVIGATTGPWGTRLSQHALRQTLASTGAVTMPAPMLFVRDAVSLFDEAGRLTDPGTRRSLERVLSTFERWVRRVKELDWD